MEDVFSLFQQLVVNLPKIIGGPRYLELFWLEKG